MVYLLIPIVLVTLVAVLGVNILAIQLTKDLQSNTGGVMINREAKVVRTASFNDFGNLFTAIPLLTTEALSDIHQLTFDTLVLPITSSKLDETSVTFSTPIVYFTLRTDKSYQVDILPGINSTANAYFQDVFDTVNWSLQELQEQSSKTLFSSKVKAKTSNRGGPGVVCRSSCLTPR